MAVARLDDDLRHVVVAEVELVQESGLFLDTDDFLHLRDEPVDVIGA